MSALHVSLYAFGAQHPTIEGKFFPRLETNHLVPAYLQLNAALLPTKAAMRFDETLGWIARFILPAARRCIRRVRTEAVKQDIWRDRGLSHETAPSNQAGPARVIFSCMPG